MEFLESNIFLIAITFLVYWGARKLQQRTGWVALNPILITIFILIAYLKITGISFETYNESGRMIEFWLKPAIVALGVPLYTQLKAIRRQ
ncbi:MAG: LrgB family protein, partial [Muribaculaceae bacterium]|nr:LrgB family protein [Muribaculaceae bacterium]